MGTGGEVTVGVLGGGGGGELGWGGCWVVVVSWAGPGTGVVGCWVGVVSRAGLSTGDEVVGCCVEVVSLGVRCWGVG